MKPYSGEGHERAFRPVKLVPRQDSPWEQLSAMEAQREPQRAFFAVQNTLSLAADPGQRNLFEMQRWSLHSSRARRRSIQGPFLPATLDRLQKAAEILDGHTDHEKVRQRLINELEGYFHPQVARRGNSIARWHERLETANTLALIAPDLVAAYERYEQTQPYDAYSHQRFLEFSKMSPQDALQDAATIRGEIQVREEYGQRHPMYQHENDTALGNLQLRHLRALAASPHHREMLAAFKQYDLAETWPSIRRISMAG